MVRVLARRFAHIPTLGLRGLLHHGPDGSLDAFLQGLDAEFAEELRRALDRAPHGRDAVRGTGRNDLSGAAKGADGVQGANR